MSKVDRRREDRPADIAESEAHRDDLRQFVPALPDLPKEQLTWRCEQAVRNYDPCISCATHFLRLEIERE